MRYTAKILKGRGDGKRIGIPTLNFAIPAELEARQGIYAGWVVLQGNNHPAAIHYGPVPTFDIDSVSLEAHLIDTVLTESPKVGEFELIEFLREIENFKTVEELQAKIAEDVKRTKEILGLPLH